MRRKIVRDGVIAGILGATAVAVWFLGVDVIYAHAFRTPTALGKGLLRLFGPPTDDSVFMLVAAYTVFHYVAFIAAGLLVSVIVHWAQTQPTVLAGAPMLFVAVENGFYGLRSALGGLTSLCALRLAPAAAGQVL